MRKTQPQPFGEIVRSIRDRAGLSQTELAQLCGVSPQRINQIEQGTRPDPRLSTIRELAKHLGVSVTELIGDVP